MPKETWKKKRTQEGESPFPPVGDRDAPEVPPEDDQQPHVEEDSFGGVTWEEKRKAKTDESPGKEGELYDESDRSNYHSDTLKKHADATGDAQ